MSEQKSHAEKSIRPPPSNAGSGVSVNYSTRRERAMASRRR
jgi:hypothetical protein